LSFTPAQRRVGHRHASTHLARDPRRARRGGRRSGDRAADGRDRPRDVEWDLRLGPAPLRGPRPAHRRGRHGDILPLLGDDDPLGVDAFATHHVPLDEAPHAYEIFQKKQDDAFKVLLTP
jgi:hypothetical protein